MATDVNQVGDATIQMVLFNPWIINDGFMCVYPDVASVIYVPSK